MTDAPTTENPGNTGETGIADPVVTKPARVVKEKPQPHRCLCAFFEVTENEGTKDEAIFTTGCEGTTLSTFQQGHDARLVGFLVSAHFDGYKLRLVKDGKTLRFASPADAAAHASEALGEKARKATERKATLLRSAEERKAAKEAAKRAKAEEKAAAKAAKAEEKANAPHAEVAAGSTEGDVPPVAPGHAKIKVGRWEYDAQIGEDGTATFVDGKGDEQTVERDAYRVLVAA